MAGPRPLPILLFALTLGALPLWAQQPGPAQEPAGAEGTTAAEEADSGRQQDAAAPRDKPPAIEDSSPYDYRASEEISEDSSVSFPVDI